MIRSFVGALLVLPLIAVAARPAAAEPPVPTVREIPDEVGVHGHPMWDPWFDPAAFGYEAHEYLVSGTAVTTDGVDAAPYATRMIVVHPSDPDDFTGTVLLDWVNVTAQFENAVNSLTSVRFLLREGWAWVHVSAQAAGLCCTPLTPQVYDPVRYAEIDHPGDEFAADMFSQIARSFVEPGVVDPLRGLRAEVVLAAGQSQSASRLSDYVRTTQPTAALIDGFLIQAGGSKVFEAPPSVPVVHLLGDREATPQAPNTTTNYVLWEVAGAAHADAWVGRQQTEGASTRLLGAGQQSRPMAETLWASAGNYGEAIDPRQAVCVVNGALFPTRYAVNAALHHLDRWVREGAEPPRPPRYEFEGGTLARDADRNARGGLRLPPIDVPVARYESDLCGLGGITIPFSEAELLARYGDHATYYALVVEATAASVAAGHLLPADAEDLLRRACAARPRFLEAGTEPCTPAGDGVAPGADDGSAPGDPPDPPTAVLPVTGDARAWLAVAPIALGAGLALRPGARRRGRRAAAGHG